MQLRLWSHKAVQPGYVLTHLGVIIASGSRLTMMRARKAASSSPTSFTSRAPTSSPLADDARPLVGSQRIGDLFELAFDEVPPLFDDEDLFKTFGEA